MEFKFFDLGLADFKRAWDFQKEIFLKVKNNELNAAVIFCQHYPVITLGRLADKKNILIPEPELKARGIQMYAIERGGDVTYHGPGQFTVYPVFNLNYFKKDIHFFLRYLEGLTIEFLANFGVKGIRQSGLTGVWVGKQKIASIGIAIKNWITFHGLSINVRKDDLANFRFIRPCGMDIEMTSLETISGRTLEINSIKELFRGALGVKQEGVYH